jgi:uracil-DNA glycosylase
MVKIHPSWQKHLSREFEKSYFSNLTEFVRQEYTSTKCYPPGGKIFSAFDRTSFDEVKVVILGQDPYHGPRQANGLCFSVSEDVAIPPSLVNIFQEIQQDVGSTIPSHGNLERWASQGVLLMNAVLTVRAGQAGSHQKKGWETFTDQVIRTLSDEKNNLVFLLWGGFAKSKSKLIDHSKHLVLESGHPSPLSANRGYWFGNRHFSQTNKYLQEHGRAPIDW